MPLKAPTSADPRVRAAATAPPRARRPGDAARDVVASRPADIVVSTSHADIAIRQSSGRKMPTLFIHGNSTSKEVFENQFASRIGQEYHLIAIDLPGHGASSNAFDPERTYSMPGYADTAVEVLEQLGIDQVAVVGWSLGGHVGMEMMALYPDLVGLMITGASPVGTSPEAIKLGFRDHPHLLLAGKQDFTDEDVENFAFTASGGSSDPEFRAAVRRADGDARGLMFASLFAGKASDQRQLAETSPIPLAVVNGADEPFVDTDYLDSLSYANLWRGKCHLIPRAGHAPFIEAPELFNHLLSRFLKNMEAVARHRLRHPLLVYSA
jgi:pimeloyl-ACP methyl ester carboxylesterase